MSKIYRMISVCLSVIMLLSVSGCQLAKEDGDYSDANNDRFVGVFITYEPISVKDDDIMDEVLEALGKETSEENVSEKIYAKIREVEEDGILSHEYYFEGYEGIYMLLAHFYPEQTGMENHYVTTYYGTEFFDTEIKSHTTDEGEFETLCGSVYLAEEIIIYENPIYQEKDGDVYALPANMGAHISGGVERTRTEEVVDGEGGMRVEVTYTVKAAPAEVQMIYMSDDNCVVVAESYKPEEMPENVSVPKDVEYIIVKSAYNGDNPAEISVCTRENVSHVVAVDRGGKTLEGKYIHFSWDE